MTKKVILDTDPGIDDAMAILFAEAHPDIELIGITTVYGNATVENSTHNALFLKQKFHMNAIVAKGTDKPLIKEQVEATVMVHGDNGLGDVTVPSSLEVEAIKTPAYQFIIDRVRAEPKEITLVAIGPLTNIALALENAPDIVDLVKEVVIMGGAFGENGHRGNVSPFSEANIHDDPDAADKVFTAAWPVIIIGLDVTEESFFTDQYLGELKDDAGEVGQFIWDISRFYLKFYSERLGVNACHVHDPSAIAYVIHPTIFKSRIGPVRVVTDGPAEGMTIQKTDQQNYMNDEWSKFPAQTVGVQVDKEALLSLYRETLINYSRKER
ncbi:nucleoside hydrolase [Vibrio sagamiensis]|uniref:Nucleoside hydrolase n=1 Tax=Vibrio sagamiensis NBRC 104589 TaxID=1219064 RepID=A0A511QIH3_9VIBR|nr:nucleoside hydrolase [Vibrio sagamiensis]PNQ53746.1 nucleoside hydrolase [Vibrio agarivorans]GEM77091.1 nucleoside hydrolase [Vibrio sagamiensis NBRC 104589]